MKRNSKFKNYVQNQINYAKRNYFLQKCQETMTSSQVWNVYNELTNFRTKKSTPIATLTYLDKPVTDPSLMCEALAEQFALSGSNDNEEIHNLLNKLNISGFEILNFMTTEEIIAALKTIRP